MNQMLIDPAVRTGCDDLPALKEVLERNAIADFGKFEDLSQTIDFLQEFFLPLLLLVAQSNCLTFLHS